MWAMNNALNRYVFFIRSVLFWYVNGHAKNIIIRRSTCLNPLNFNILLPKVKMEKKWRILIISIIIYQLILTLMMLKLDHYAQWLHFNFSEFPDTWITGGGTAPMRSALMWLGVTLLILIGVNIYHFRSSRSADPDWPKDPSNFWPPLIPKSNVRIGNGMVIPSLS